MDIDNFKRMIDVVEIGRFFTKLDDYFHRIQKLEMVIYSL